MINQHQIEKRKEDSEAIDLLNNFAPATDLGKRLLTLAKQRRQSSVSALEVEEISAELGRQRDGDSDVC